MKLAFAVANAAPADMLARVVSLLGDLPDAARLAVSRADASRETPAFQALVEVWGAGPAAARAALGAELRAGWLRGFALDAAEPVPLPRPAPGAPAAGVRILTLCRRRAGLARAEFARIWREEHARVALAFTVAPRGYAQDVVLESLAPPDDVDGIACLHFVSYAEFDARYREHPEEAARGLADAGRCIDLARSESAFAIETLYREARSGAAPGAGRRAPGRTP